MALIWIATATANASAECKVVPHSFPNYKTPCTPEADCEMHSKSPGPRSPSWEESVPIRVSAESGSRTPDSPGATTKRGRWHFTHLLNHCGSDRSELFDDGPVDFFLERPFSYTAQIIIPVPALQKALVQRLEEHEGGALHEAALQCHRPPLPNQVPELEPVDSRAHCSRSRPWGTAPAASTPNSSCAT